MSRAPSAQRLYVVLLYGVVGLSLLPLLWLAWLLSPLLYLVPLVPFAFPTVRRIVSERNGVDGRRHAGLGLLAYAYYLHAALLGVGTASAWTALVLLLAALFFVTARFSAPPRALADWVVAVIMPPAVVVLYGNHSTADGVRTGAWEPKDVLLWPLLAPSGPLVVVVVLALFATAWVVLDRADRGLGPASGVK